MSDRKIRAALKTISTLRAEIDRLEELLRDLDSHGGRTVDMLDSRQAAEAAGLAASTWQTYVSIGKAPAADEVVSGRPLWRLETVQRWAKSRKARTR